MYSDLEPRFSATLGLSLAKKFWGMGLGLEAQEAVLKFLFEELGLVVVRLYTHSGNPQAVRLAEKSGFQVSVRQRQSIFRSGQMFDNLTLDLLREEYYARHPELADRMPVIAPSPAPR